MPLLSLESWIHGTIKKNFARDAEFRRFVNKGRLASVTRSDVGDYQDFKLRRILQYCAEKSTFYRKLFRTASVDFREVSSSLDLGKLPFTEPRHIAESPYEFLCISQAAVARIYTFITSGTAGPKKKVFWTQGDLDRITDFMAAGIRTVADIGDTVLILLPNGRPNSQADLLCKGVTKSGAVPVVGSIDLDAQELQEIIQQSRCKVIFGYTRKLFRLSKELQLQKNLSVSGVKTLFLAAEYLPDAMRLDLKQMWNSEVRTHYGLTEMGLGVAVECEAGQGYHFNEADLLLEVIDPHTGKPVAADEEGELVFTTLTREAMPLIRYRTHDLSRLVSGPCPCGAATLLKIDHVKKRLENIVIIGDGDEMYPSLFDDVLFEIPGLVDYEVTITREAGRDRLCFGIELVSDEKQTPAIESTLLSAPIIAKNITAGKMAPPTIELVARGALRSTGRAKRMIFDRRP
jgi:phenylacetate-CoA ligase